MEPKPELIKKASATQKQSNNSSITINTIKNDLALSIHLLILLHKRRVKIIKRSTCKYIHKHN
jgi:hypothetical protein